MYERFKTNQVYWSLKPSSAIRRDYGITLNNFFIANSVHNHESNMKIKQLFFWKAALFNGRMRLLAIKIKRLYFH